MRPIVYSLLISLAINTAGLFSVDRTFFLENRKAEILNQQKISRAEREKIFFDFIEAPPVVSAKPKAAKKISNRDSTARDLPKKIGPADQLAQLRAKPSQNPSSASKPQREIKKAEPRPHGSSQSADVTLPFTPKPPSPARQHRDGTKEFSGISRITTQEMTKIKSKGARLFGMTSFDAMGSDMGVYMKNLKEKVWLAWFPYLAFQYPSDFHAADAVVSFTLDPKGEVKIVKVVESYGSPQFTTFCVESVQRASGFGAIPKEILALIGKDGLEIKFAFHYR